MARKFWAGARGMDGPGLATSGDIDIRIFRSDQPDGACRVTISGTDDRRADGVFRSPFSKAEINEALGWMDLATPWDSPAASSVRQFGKRLFEALFQGAVAGVYVASQDANSPPRVRLTVDDPAAARIPWELLVNPATGEALALRGRFVRGIASEGGARRLVVDPPLRVMVVECAPRGVPRLDSQLEARDISSALAGVVAQGRMEVVTLQHATLSAVVDALREAASAQPARPFHVLHWIGHGFVDPVSGANQLLFEDDEGGVDRVDGARLASVLVGSEIRLVLLNACHSAAPAEPALVSTPAAETTRGIAEVLLTAGIPAVVGMRVAVLDDTARLFAREFYAALADGRGVDDAVLDARILVTGRASGVSAEVGVPVAYLRSGSGQLLSGVQPLAWWQVPLVRFRRLTPLARVAVFVAVVIATLVVERSVEAIVGEIQGPQPMTSELNVAVTQFDGRDSANRPIALGVASGLARDFALELEDELKASTGPRAEVRLPDDAGRLQGGSAEERAVAASSLADRINADIVVYGSLDASGTTLQPEFFVREGRLADAEELAGVFRLGSPVRTLASIETEVAARQSMRSQLVSRASALADLIAGLSAFRLGDYTTADQHFAAAMEDDGWADGKEVVYLFRGVAAGVRDQLDQAERWFEEALELDSAYVRARLGIAEVAFQRAKGSCEPGDSMVDGGALREAAQAYAAAVTAADDPEAVSVSARGRLGVARVYICISNAGIEDLWDEAAGEASKVIAAYEAGDTLLRQLAAEAHAVRGITRLPLRSDPDPRPRFESAAEDFRAAIELATHADRKAAYHAQLAYVLGRLGLVGEAQSQYELAIENEPDPTDKARYQQERDALDEARPSPSGQGGSGVRLTAFSHATGGAP